MGLKKGLKVNILVGADGDRHIGIEGAWVALITHFSQYAKEQLLKDKSSVLVIPNGCKDPVVWIYRYMFAGENNPQGLKTFQELSLEDLILIYRHCSFLEYQTLMDRIIGRLKGMYCKVLPSVEDIKVFTTLIPALYTQVIDILAYEMITPRAFNCASYLAFASEDTSFGEALAQMMQNILAQRQSRAHPSRYVKWS